MLQRCIAWSLAKATIVACLSSWRFCSRVDTNVLHSHRRQSDVDLIKWPTYLKRRCSRACRANTFHLSARLSRRRDDGSTSSILHRVRACKSEGNSLSAPRRGEAIKDAIFACEVDLGFSTVRAGDWRPVALFRWRVAENGCAPIMWCERVLCRVWSNRIPFNGRATEGLWSA